MQDYLNNNYNHNLVDSAKNFQENMEIWSSSHSSIKTYMFAGCGLGTIHRIIEQTDSAKPYYIGQQNGDSTVPLQSAIEEDTSFDKRYLIKKIKHMSLPGSKGAFTLLDLILKGDEDSFIADNNIREYDGSAACDEFCELNEIEIVLDNPCIEIEVLGGDYRVSSDWLTYYIPNNGQYKLRINGTSDSDGLLDLKLRLLQEGGYSKTVIFYQLPLPEGGIGEFIINSDLVDPVMDIDINGDEIFESHVNPTDVLDFPESNDFMPPLTTADITGTIGGTGWYLPDVSINLAATDNAGGSGLSATYYRLQGDTNFTEYTDSIMISEIGKHTLTFYSIDRNLNRETNKTLEFTIDNGPPQVISSTPSNLSSGADRPTSIHVVFSEMMDVSLLTESNITVDGSITGIHEGSISYDSVTNTLTFDPDTEFMLQEDVIMTISGEIADMSGITLDGNENDLSEGSPSDDYTFSFIINESDGLIVRTSELTPIFCPTIQPVVIVTDENGDVVPDLQASAFTLYEDNIANPPLSVDFVNLISSPVSVSLALDYSGSMGSTAITDMEDAAAEFINDMIEEDAGEIIKFADGVETMQEFTTDKTNLIDAVYAAPTIPNSSTSLYDAVYQAVTESSAETGRKAVIVITDGNDTSSSHNDSEVIAYAQTNEIPVFTIGLGTSINATILEAIAEQTGGALIMKPRHLPICRQFINPFPTC
jgi:uncharacterized protein YegL